MRQASNYGIEMKVSEIEFLVPAPTGKMGEQFPVREFWTFWKSLGILNKILEKSGKLKKVELIFEI